MAASVSEKPEWMHKTTTATMKRPIQLRNRGCKEHQRTFCYMALGYQQISAWDCAPPSSRFSSPTPPPVLALLYIVLSAGGLSAGGQRKNPRHRPDDTRASIPGRSVWISVPTGHGSAAEILQDRRNRREVRIDHTYDSLAEATTSRKRGARGCGRRIPGRARRAAQGLRCDARLGRGRSGGRWNPSWAGEGRMNPRNALLAGRVGMGWGSCSVV